MGLYVGLLEMVIVVDFVGYGGFVVFMLFNFNFVVVLVELLFEIVCGLIICSWCVEYWLYILVCIFDDLCFLEDYDCVGVCFVSYEYIDFRLDWIIVLK